MPSVRATSFASSPDAIVARQLGTDPRSVALTSEVDPSGRVMGLPAVCLWAGTSRSFIELARANRIPPRALPQMAERSLAWMTELLPPPSTRDLDAALPEALARAIEDLERSADRTKATQDVLKELKLQRWVFAQRRATWKDWTVLAAVEPAKKSQDLIETLRTTAAEFEAHPRFQNELREMITGVFDCARLGLERYQSWKECLRLVDYVDMLERALGLLDRPEVARELAERLGMVVVDEFQDTSPIQLELFLRLHQLTHRSTWVGDRKQCIFEFAGADPQLMDSVTRWVADNGGSSEQLPFNYRSRPGSSNFAPSSSPTPSRPMATRAPKWPCRHVARSATAPDPSPVAPRLSDSSIAKNSPNQGGTRDRTNAASAPASSTSALLAPATTLGGVSASLVRRLPDPC
jgi:ATP-dependent helicase/nuclease subunit A